MQLAETAIMAVYPHGTGEASNKSRQTVSAEEGNQMQFTHKTYDLHTKQELAPSEDNMGRDTYGVDTCECGGNVVISLGGRYADCKRCNAHWEYSYNPSGWIHRW